MPTTTNFGWTTPADTDLVKDGAAAIRTVAGNIDTSFVDLKGGTTGQVLAKASATDLDYSWNTPSGMVLLETLALSGASVTSASIPTTYKNLFIVIKGVQTSTAALFRIRFNSDTSGNYYIRRFRNLAGVVQGATANAQTSLTDIWSTDSSATATLQAFAQINIYRYADTDITYGDYTATNTESGSTHGYTGNFLYDQSAAISTITLLPSTGTFSAGNAYIYGVN
jgi:hypothetical protein